MVIEGKLTQVQSVLSADSRMGLRMYSPLLQLELPGAPRTA